MDEKVLYTDISVEDLGSEYIQHHLLVDKEDRISDRPSLIREVREGMRSLIWPTRTCTLTSRILAAPIDRAPGPSNGKDTLTPIIDYTETVIKRDPR